MGYFPGALKPEQPGVNGVRFAAKTNALYYTATAKKLFMGAILQIIPQRLVIQSWRSTKFNDGDPDSTLILAFTPEGTNGRIDLVPTRT